MWFTPSLLVLLIFCMEARAGAWALRPGSGKAMVSLSYLQAESVTDGSGEKQSFAIKETALSTFGEVGLTKNVAAGWSWTPGKSAVTDSFDAVSTGDPEISLTCHLLSAGPWQVAAQAMGVFSLGSKNPERSPDFLYGVFSHRAFKTELRPLVGWAGGGYWAQGGAGPRWRSHDLSAQFHYNLAGGGRWGTRFGWQMGLSGITPLDTKPSGKPGDQEEYFGFQLLGQYHFTPAIQAGIQLDGMVTLGQEMPLGSRVNIFARYAWKAPD